jgi:hypothetical protein
LFLLNHLAKTFLGPKRIFGPVGIGLKCLDELLAFRFLLIQGSKRDCTWRESTLLRSFSSTWWSDQLYSWISFEIIWPRPFWDGRGFLVLLEWGWSVWR